MSAIPPPSPLCPASLRCRLSSSGCVADFMCGIVLCRRFSVLVCQLEHQFMCEKLSLQGLWYHLQPTLRLFALLERLVAILSNTHSVNLETI